MQVPNEHVQLRHLVTSRCTLTPLYNVSMCISLTLEVILSLSIFPGAYRSVLATPGWHENDSTPEPLSRRLNSQLLMMLNSFVRPYMSMSDAVSLEPLQQTTDSISLGKGVLTEHERGNQASSLGNDYV